MTDRHTPDARPPVVVAALAASLIETHAETLNDSDVPADVLAPHAEDLRAVADTLARIARAVSATRHTMSDDGPCPGCYSPDCCHRTPAAVAARAADVYRSDGGEI